MSESASLSPGVDAWLLAGIADRPSDPLEEADSSPWSLLDPVRERCHDVARLTSDLVSEARFAELAGTRQLPLPFGHG